jgi:hypothetical protein
MRSNYWSCSKFANKVLGVARPTALSSEDWNEWEAKMKKERPVRYWLADVALDSLQDAVMWIPGKFRSVGYYIENRWVTRTHTLTASADLIKRGKWCDLSDRFLPCMFSELVEFVEVETAWRWVAWNPEEAKKYNAPKRNSRKWRCPEAGIASLEWSANLVYNEEHNVEPGHELYGKPMDQAANAKEILELYRWFKDVWPNRPDPHDEAGYGKYEKNTLLWDYTDEEKEELRAIFQKANVISTQYDNEDTEMMIRLIKVRNSLWT